MGTLTPDCTLNGVTPKYASIIRSSVRCTGGTTFEMATSVICPGSIPRERRRVWMKRPYSSEVCSRRLVRRQEAISLAPSCTPTLVLVLPTSSSRSTGDLPRDDAQQRAVLRTDEQGSGLVEVHRDALAAVGGADTRAQGHAVAAPGRP